MLLVLILYRQQRSWAPRRREVFLEENHFHRGNRDLTLESKLALRKLTRN